MNVKIIVDRFSSRKGLKEKMVIKGRLPTRKEIYEFLGGRDYEIVNRLMEGIYSE